LDPANSADDEALFYEQVHSMAMAELIKNTVTPAGLTKILKGHASEISFVDPVNGATFYDGPCLLYLLWDRVDPSLSINVENLREDIEKTRLHQFSNNVDDLLSHIEDKYQRILDMNKSCESIVRYTMNALLSGPDKEFNRYMRAMKGDIDAGTGQHANISYGELVAASRNKYQNMVAQGEYGKVDPRETQMIALATEVQQLRGQLASANTTSKAPGGNYARPVDRSNDTPGLDRTILPGTVIEKWRIVQHGDGTACVICDGKQYWKCSHHVDKAGRWSFMYVRHKEEDHEAAVAKFKKKKPKTEDDANAHATQTSNAKLVVGDKLKEVLCSRFMVGDKDATDICAEILNQGKD